MLKINHVHFKSPDPQSAVQWYIDNLGATIISENRNPDGKGGFFRLDLHGLPLNISGLVQGQEREQSYGFEHIAVDTDDLPKLSSQLESNGSRLLEEKVLPSGRRICFFEAPDGTCLEVLETAQPSN